MQRYGPRNSRRILRYLRKSYVNRAGRRLRSVIRRILGIRSDVILSMRTGSVHGMAHAPFVRPFICMGSRFI